MKPVDSVAGNGRHCLMWLYCGLMLCLMLLFPSGAMLAATASLDFTLHKQGASPSAPTLLIIGGIQGDEPGGFNAASLLVTDYQIDYGNVWVVPNLNFESIVHRSRGVHGDMNRKFLDLAEQDPEYDTVQKIKSIILNKQVDVVLNLHDGSGYYRPRHQDSLHGPHRWGQSLIVDQAELDDARYGNLSETGERVIRRVNQRLLDSEHRYHLKNTHTRKGDREMEKTLTYFAIRNKKAAFGVEASKSLNTEFRAFYHLNVIEAFMQEMGIEFRRDFTLEPAHVKQAIEKELYLAMFNKRLFLDMTNARDWLRYVPMTPRQPMQIEASNPLLAVVGSGRHYKVRYGNRGVANLHPEFMEFDDSLKYIPVLVDDRYKLVRPGEKIMVRNNFMVIPQTEYRVNIIGFVHDGVDDEAGVFVSYENFMPRFSIDRQAKKFRVEVYRGDKFSGMILADFTQQSSVDAGVDLAYYPRQAD
ncbi:MAG: M99 family carboxypeptidase catalytic domain-containing protein [Thiohalophilus sp.]|uniref:M14 family metallopeptidase n=1 Tax=Thiohalophilus sp. TaxID=3028392 RepID=UPI0028702424|nr:M99 family carboxypeptidase catalytic domain-containing protein [Thiohalophilus sp.]MDR9436356.1 M99 family carboxypeptidase catalytic domain-containing protein [Thiohalophilus sp.]